MTHQLPAGRHRVTTEVHLGPMGISDVRELAQLHRRAFPGFFLSALGEPFLVQFYRGFLQDRTSVTVVARDPNGRLRGAVVGTTEPAGFFRRMMRRQWPGFMAAGARALLTNPKATPRLLRAVTYRGNMGPATAEALLSSIFVDPAFQGSGVGSQLIDEWVQVATCKGASRVFLDTDAIDNESTNEFYLARGWHLACAYNTREGRKMNSDMTRLGTR